MGIFGNREELRSVDTDAISVHPAIAGKLPDAGEFLFRQLSFLHEDSLSELAAEIARVRHPNGSIPRRNLQAIGLRDWKSGPLTHLVWMTAKDMIVVGVWATLTLSRGERQQFEKTVVAVAEEQGIAAAATWAMLSRPDGNLHVESLASQLEDSWSESMGLIRNGEIIKSFQKWRR